MIYIHGAGHFHPENIIDNQFLEDLDIGTTDTWIRERVGIVSRRTVLDLDYIRSTRNQNPSAAREASLYSNAETGAQAGYMALEKAGLTSKDIGLVVSGSCSPQYSCPAEACTIAAQMNIDAPSFDINSACSSLAAQLNYVQQMDTKVSPEFFLLLSPENNTRAIDYNDRNNAVLWGDGSSALVVSKKHKSQFVIKHSLFTSSPAGWDKVTIPTGGWFKQEGRTVQSFAIKRCMMMIRKLREYVPVETQIDLKFIGHQANLMMLDSVCRMAEITQDNHYFNVDTYGNCGAAGAPSVLSMNWDQFKHGDRLVLAVVGSGLSWGGGLIEVDDQSIEENQ